MVIMKQANECNNSGRGRMQLFVQSYFCNCVHLTCIYMQQYMAASSSCNCSCPFCTVWYNCTWSTQCMTQVSIGTRAPFLILHPIVSSGGSTEHCLSACCHTDAWEFARFMWKDRTLCVGGKVSKSWAWAKRVDLALSAETLQSAL